jgi:large subunit ribosomal protein L9
MKVVLRQDVPKLGEAGTVQDVSGGFARNYLVPRGLAVYATEGELKMAAHNQAVKDRKIARQEEQLRSLADKIDGQVVTFEARAGEGGRLFGSITAAEIAEQLSSKIGEDVDRRRVQLEEPIRTVGEHTVNVHLVGRLRPSVRVMVNAEAGSATEAEEGTDAPAEEAPEMTGEDEVTAEA